MNWYVIYVLNGSIEEVLKSLNRQTEFFAFSPKVEKFVNFQGEKFFSTREMFPNYIFIESYLDGYEIYNLLVNIDLDFSICGLKQKFVGSVDDDLQKFLNSVLDDNKILIRSQGVIKQSSLTIYDGPLTGKEKIIEKINRHKRYAVLKFELFERKIFAPLEVPIKEV